ncbi:hypothetical protein TNCV_2858841 [Trichonephila clavipes]|nr:hypothetical protein TNCV_2858841 [Trichonephila clavipes]
MFLPPECSQIELPVSNENEKKWSELEIRTNGTKDERTPMMFSKNQNYVIYVFNTSDFSREFNPLRTSQTDHWIIFRTCLEKLVRICEFHPLNQTFRGRKFEDNRISLTPPIADGEI